MTTREAGGGAVEVENEDEEQMCRMRIRIRKEHCRVMMIIRKAVNSIINIYIMMMMMIKMKKTDPSEDFLRDKVDAAVLRP